MIDGQRASALRFVDQRAQAILSAPVIFRLGPAGFAARDLRRHFAPLLGLAEGRIVADSLDVEDTSVGLCADLPQGGQVEAAYPPE